MNYLFKVLEIPFLGTVVFYFVVEQTSVPTLSSSYVRGKIFLPEWDQVFYLSFPTLKRAQEYLDELS